MSKWLIEAAKMWSRSWHERINAVFAAVIIASCLSIFEGYWWDETFKAVYWTIAWTAGVMFVLPPGKIWLKLLLQLVGAVWITARMSAAEQLSPWPEQRSEWFGWLREHAEQLHPLIWFSLVLLALVMLFGSWTSTRMRIFGFLGSAIVLLTVADSFTPIWLWDNVAAVVLTGLLWLVTDHFARLQRKHPDSWKELLEYPVQLLMPMIIVLSVLMLSGISMPALAPLLKDPYTLWKNARGEKVEVYLGEKAIPVQFEPISLGNANSGYSRNDDTLGGGFDFDYSPMMTVTTTHRSYWRGESKDTYTGSGWQDGNANELFPVSQNTEFASGVDRTLAETVQVSQTISMIRDDVYPVLFAAAPVSNVQWINGAEESFPQDILWSPDDWELRWMRAYIDNSYPDAYALTSTVAVLDEEVLRHTYARSEDDEFVQRYLQLPDGLPERVKQLARDVTAEAATDYDKAKALETYLRSNYMYTNKPDLSKLSGGSGDFVDQFLFELLEGYCDYFSTSMAVMARSIDLPARWVKGFSSGVLPMDNYGPPMSYLEGEDINPNGSGTYTVRNSDAHSWVEVYFEGYGWVPFEPTSGFSFPYRMPEGEEVSMPVSNLPDSSSGGAAASEGGISAGVWNGLAAIVVLAAAAVVVLLRRRELISLWQRIGSRVYSPNERMVLETNKLLKRCMKRGMVRAEHQTLREALTGFIAMHKRLRDDLLFVLDGFERAKYGSAAMSHEEANRYITKVRYVMEELK